tara:strand:- start:255 stop:392 length:138 start_codon:yes stop_codon:yes gene_type:complete
MKEIKNYIELMKPIWKIYAILITLALVYGNVLELLLKIKNKRKNK